MVSSYLHPPLITLSAWVRAVTWRNKFIIMRGMLRAMGGCSAMGGPLICPGPLTCLAPYMP